MKRTLLRGPLLNPKRDGTVEFIPDAVLADDEHGRIEFVGPSAIFPGDLNSTSRALGVICPPFLDAHIHIPQHPIRGEFVKGVADDAPGGRLLAGLQQNVFPREARCSEHDYAQATIEEFARDTLAHGVVGGAAYMTVHADATNQALATLGQLWNVGLVLMNQNCPDNLQNDARVIESMEELGRAFGRRAIITDRFAVAVNSDLRRKAARIAEKIGLRCQTHLNEQIPEKDFIEKTLYPNAESYTDVYLKDGLLDSTCILAHCIHMRPREWQTLVEKKSVVAHCPTSNTLLGSGIMSLDKLVEHGIDYAICTDVGASPTTSLLAEMQQFLFVHANRSRHATPSAALWRSTLGPARLLGLDQQVGTFEIGMPMHWVELASDGLSPSSADAMIADEVIERAILRFAPPSSRQQLILDRLSHAVATTQDLRELRAHFDAASEKIDSAVLCVGMDGHVVYRRS